MIREINFFIIKCKVKLQVLQTKDDSQLWKDNRETEAGRILIGKICHGN